MFMFNEEQMQAMNKILGMTTKDNPICKECKFYNCCFFAFECISDNYKNFEENS